MLLSICTSTGKSSTIPGRLIFAAGAGILLKTCCNAERVARAGTVVPVSTAPVCPPPHAPEGIENLNIGNYDEFLQARRQLMAEKIHQYYQKL
jgi:hypothetical protein